MQQAANSFLDYVLRLSYRTGEADARVDDRMCLVSHDLLFNESTLSKLGWRVDNLVLVIDRRPAGP